MKRYLNYINEKKYENEYLDEDATKNIINNFCSDFNLDDKPIYRSIQESRDFILVKRRELRQSAYSKNYYTLLINNLETWSKYPKRQHICYNNNISFNFELYRVIPFNGAKVGVCIGDDIQAPFLENTDITKEMIGDDIESFINLTRFIGNFDYKLSRLYELPQGTFSVSEIDWYQFKEDIKKVHEYLLNNKIDWDKKSTDETTKKLYIEEFNKLIKYSDINELERLIKPEPLSFEVYDYKDYAKTELDGPKISLHGYHKPVREIWLDSDILLINEKIYDEFIKTLL